MLGFCCSFAFAGPRDPSPVPPDYRFRNHTWSSVRNMPIPYLTRARGERLMEYHDRVLKCAECSAEFVFTAGEQMFFADKGFKNEPKRCKGCKAKRAEGGGGGGGSSQMRSETKTTCSQCGKETTVPFRPTQGRPVFCRECFQQRRALGAA